MKTHCLSLAILAAALVEASYIQPDLHGLLGRQAGLDDIIYKRGFTGIDEHEFEDVYSRDLFDNVEDENLLYSRDVFVRSEDEGLLHIRDIFDGLAEEEELLYIRELLRRTSEDGGDKKSDKKPKKSHFPSLSSLRFNPFKSKESTTTPVEQKPIKNPNLSLNSLPHYPSPQRHRQVGSTGLPATYKPGKSRHFTTGLQGGDSYFSKTDADAAEWQKRQREGNP